MESGTKKYGLLVPKKKLDGVMKITNVFGDDSDSESEAKNKPIQTNNRTKAQQRSAKLVIDKALEEDATVFQYDEVYDDMEKKKESLVDKEKKVDKKPKYIQNLLVQAEKRKIEYERRNERLIQKEREQEGDEFNDKEAFVTSSYKKKLEEMKIMDAEDKKLDLIEDINDKHRNMGSFYRHLFKEEVCKDVNNESDDIKQPIKKSDANRQYRKRASSESSDEVPNDDRDMSDSDSSVDSIKRQKTEKCDVIKSENEGLEPPQEKLEVSLTEISKENLKEEEKEKKSLNDKPESKQSPKDKKIEKNESKPKEIKPKINIWKKRTVGDIFEAARQRYFERKMKRINLLVSS